MQKIPNDARHFRHLGIYEKTFRGISVIHSRTSFAVNLHETKTSRTAMLLEHHQIQSKQLYNYTQKLYKTIHFFDVIHPSLIPPSLKPPACHPWAPATGQQGWRFIPKVSVLFRDVVLDFVITGDQIRLSQHKLQENTWFFLSELARGCFV